MSAAAVTSSASDELQEIQQRRSPRRGSVQEVQYEQATIDVWFFFSPFPSIICSTSSLAPHALVTKYWLPHDLEALLTSSRKNSPA
jgi:hypothetical protein